MEKIAHIRVGVRVASRRVMGDRGDPGRTLCGAGLTWDDGLLRDFQRNPSCVPPFKWCPSCVEAAKSYTGRKHA